MQLITDPVIELGKPKSKWSITCHNGVIITPSESCGALRLSVVNTSGANWHGEVIFAPIQVVEGATYGLSFYARAQNPFLFSVWLGQMESPYASLVADENHFGEKMITPEWTLFTHTWTAVQTEERARLDFVVGRIDNVVEMRDVELKIN